MRAVRLTSAAFAVVFTAALPVIATANEELLKMQGNPKEWVMPTGNYANWRYSELRQINKENVKNLQVAWTFSTGVLRDGCSAWP